MKKRLLFCLFLVLSFPLYLSAFTPMKSDVYELDDLLKSYQKYDAEKRTRIQHMVQSIPHRDDLYGLYKDLYNEYKSYNFDTALIYVRHLEDQAAFSPSPERRFEVLMARGFTYLSGGLFKEAYEVMEQIKQENLPVDARYYTNYARLLWDMGTFCGGNNLAEQYNRQGIEKMNRAVALLSPADTTDYWFSLGSIDMQQGLYARSIQRFKMALEGSMCSSHDSAMIYSTMAFEYMILGDTTAAFHGYVQAASCDIRSCTHEAIALRYAAKLMYEHGDTERAEQCIRLAQADAVHYNARHRQVEISQILPIIENHQVAELQRDKRLMISMAAISLVLLIIVAVILLILIRRTHAMHQAQDTIKEMNDTLLVANHVKEQLLSNMLAGQSQFLSEVENYQQSVRQNAANHRYAELQIIPKPADAHRRREVFYRQLDEMLLSIYPTFVEDFNALLRPGEQITLKPGESLNTELRIFALMRLGIRQNESIAQVLDYSVNTVYTYKTRIKSKSDLSNDDFLQAVLSIPSFQKKNL